jgi:hypothetical protein
MVSESHQWLLEILIWTEWCNLPTQEFGLNRSKIWENSEYQSRWEFHKLSKEGGNSELWYGVKESWSIEVDRILEIRLQIWIDFFKFLFIFKVHFLMQYECMMSCNMSALYVPHQKKSSPNIDGVRVVGGKSHSTPWLALSDLTYSNMVSVRAENTTDIYDIHHHLSHKWRPCV